MFRPVANQTADQTGNVFICQRLLLRTSEANQVPISSRKWVT